MLQVDSVGWGSHISFKCFMLQVDSVGWGSHISFKCFVLQVDSVGWGSHISFKCFVLQVDSVGWGSHISFKHVLQVDSVGWGSHISFKEVLDHLLMIVALPVRQALNKDSPTFPSSLVENTCALMTSIISELAASATGLEVSTTNKIKLIHKVYLVRVSTYLGFNFIEN